MMSMAEHSKPINVWFDVKKKPLGNNLYFLVQVFNTFTRIELLQETTDECQLDS